MFIDRTTKYSRIIVSALAVLIVPNIVLIILQRYYDFDRSLINLDYPLVFLLFLKRPWLGRIAFLAVFFIDLLTAITGHLRIGWATTFGAIHFGFTAGVVRDMLNVLDLSIVATVLGGCLAWGVLEKVRSRTRRTAIVAAMILIAAIDALASPSALVKHGDAASAINLSGSGLVRAWHEIEMDRRSVGPITKNQSAVESALSKPYARRILVVVVESWGMPANEQAELYALSSLLTPEVRKRYEIRTGSVEFHNSTSGAELRELCGLKGAFAPSVDIGTHVCLPQQLVRDGYGTTALHGYFGSFYDREVWYRRLGFERILFLGDLAKNYLFQRRCGSAFRGLCDADVGTAVGRELVSRPRSKQFIYWLTLSSHLPIAPNSAQDSRHDCKHFTVAEAADMCNLFKSWDVVFSSLEKSLTQPGLPPTDVVIVGDHAPPFVKQSQTRWFDQKRVAWISLRPKDDAF